MSYSINVRGTSVASVLGDVVERLDEVVKQQAVHALDRDDAEDTVECFLALVGEPPEGQELSVSVAGSVATVDGRVTGVGVSVTINLITPIAG